MTRHPGLLAVGNAAGEAHPIIAEGISMALQSSWLLAGLLIAHGTSHPISWIRQRYIAAWQSLFLPRLRVARLLAHWAMNPLAIACSLPLIRTLPRLLTWGAQFSGKTLEVAHQFPEVTSWKG